MTADKGKPAAETRIFKGKNALERDIAYRNLLRLQPTKVDQTIADVIAKLRGRR